VIDPTVTALAILGGTVVEATTELPPLGRGEGFAMYLVYSGGGSPVRAFGDLDWPDGQ
jgi:hypothetical protein